MWMVSESRFLPQARAGGWGDGAHRADLHQEALQRPQLRGPRGLSGPRPAERGHGAGGGGFLFFFSAGGRVGC